MMEQYNTSMRVAATEAAIRFIQRHAAGAGEHSERYLAELGLKAGDVSMKGKDAQMLLHKQDFLDAGYNENEANARAVKMRAAVNKWVDGAVLRPDAADVPVWMNDPHFMLVSHLKRFTYAFHKTILARVMHEAKYANYGPAMALASYVPVMMAADFARGLVQGGGALPTQKQNWDTSDWLWNESQRAGLFGVGQFGVDALEDIHRGGSGIGALTGPTIDQLADAVKVLGGREQFGPFAMKSMPANALYSGFMGNEAPDPKFVD